MRIPQPWFEVFTRFAALLAAVAIAGCGSTSPSAPSPVSNPPAQYPSLVGHWTGTGRLLLHYRDGSGEGQLACQVGLDMLSQTGGHFEGVFALNGTGPSERLCFSSINFTATMQPDGTITDFRLPGALGLGSCTPVSDLTFSGTATNTNIKITLTDRAMCQDVLGAVKNVERVRDADRSLTITVSRFPPVSAS
jgi:hypothetical protein